MLFSNSQLPSSNKQKGLALITVLFIFALASMLVLNMQQRQRANIEQTKVTLALTQMQTLALSLEEIAKSGLIKDMEYDQNQKPAWDSATESWNQIIPITEHGINASISIRDMQGLFNLNSLQNNPEAQQRFERLLADILILNSSDITTELTARLNPNASAFNIKGAGIPLTHISELLLLDSMTQEDYEKLKSFIATLPVGTPLNINTAPIEVLKSWDPSLTRTQARDILNLSHGSRCEPLKQDQFGIENVGDLWNHATIKQLVSNTNNKLWNQTDFDVSTQYFSVLIQIHFNEQVLMLESLIWREQGSSSAIVVYRDFSKSIDDPNLREIECTKFPS